ncbi:MAG: hypothetical protein ABF297_03325 [Thiogranum sp.]
MFKGLLSLAVALFLLITAYQAWEYYFRVDQPQALLLTEDALATEDLLALGSFNVAHAVRLEQTFLGEPDTRAAGQQGLLDDTAFARFQAAGIDPRRDLTNLVLAFYLDDEHKPAIAAAMLGRFDQDRVLSWLNSEYEVSAEKAGRWPVWRVRKQDIDTCDWSQAWSLYMSSSLILLTEPEHMALLLGRLTGKAQAQRGLLRWRDFRASQLGSLALFVPDASPDTGNPFLQQPLNRAHDALDVFNEIYFGLGVWPVPVRGRLQLMLAGEDTQAASRLASEFQAALDASRQHWGQQMPTVARLYDALSVEAQAGAVRLSASFDRDWVDALGKLPAEIIDMISAGSGLRMNSASQTNVQERIDADPARFLPVIDSAALPAYQAEPPFLAAADTVSGPFGLRLSAIELGSQPEDGLQLTVSGIHRGIPNLGAGKKRVQLYIEQVTDAAGNQLLREEPCGRERNSLPADLDGSHFKNSARGEKTVRLKTGVRHADVQRIAGRVDLLLPVQTETLKLDSISDETSIDRDGLRVSLQRSGDDTLSYKVYGDARRLLAVRGLNAAGQPLSHTSSMSSGFLFGEGRSVSQSFAGKVVAAELVLATHDVQKSFPFELTNSRPTSSTSESKHEPASVEPYSLAQLAQDFDSAPRLPEEAGAILAESAAGPFRLALTRLDKSLFGLRSGITLYAQPVPGLADNLSAVVIEVNSVENAAGENLLSGPPHREPVKLQQDWRNRSLLQGQVRVRFEDKLEEDVARIKGHVHLSLATRVDAVSMDAIEVGTRVSSAGQTVTLHRVDDKGFSLDFGNRQPAVVAVNAYNAAGDSIWVPHPQLSEVDDRWLGVFATHGAAARIEVLLAGEIEERRYPFTFSVERGD